MIITVDSNGTSVEEIDDLQSLKVLTSRDQHETASSVQRAGAGRLVDDRVAIDPSYLRAAAEASGVDARWAEKFDEMVAYAASRGWVTQEGALLAHIEQTDPRQELDRRAFRDTLGHYASGVTVISTMEDELPVGFTCQSFYSVSMDPPLISFSVMTSSTTYPKVRASGRFAVNVLAHHQHEVSNQFARKGTDKWAGIAWRPSATGNPVLEDTLMWLDCKLWAEYPAGDHYIVVGEVLSMSPADWHRHDPLLFFKGAYRGLAPANV